VQSAERLAEAKASWITDRATRERQADILFNLLDSEGKLDVALVTNSDALETHDAVVDALGEYDLEPVEDLTLDAPIGDFPAEDAGWAPLAERVRSSGATAVLIAGNPSSTIRNRAAFGPDVDIWVLDQETLLNLGTSVSAEDARGVLAAAPPSNQLDLDSFADCRVTSPPIPELFVTARARATDDNVLAACRSATSRPLQDQATAAGEDRNNEIFSAALSKA
jgi:ABC-type branched-subunit amino acid transport system substrate-binding protein